MGDESNMTEELQQTLNELCYDLCCTTTNDNVVLILNSLIALTANFAKAQRLLGRSLAAPLLSEHDERLHHFQPTTNLTVLAERFMYQKETSLYFISFLGVLACDNVLNQKRITRNIPGIRIIRPIDSIKDAVELVCQSNVGCAKKSRRMRNGKIVLYALTVPAHVKSTYKKWRKRQRDLHVCRIPSGVPPVLEGVPMPCYCDECLGAEQLLPTWRMHFCDLSRWKRHSSSSCSNPVYQQTGNCTESTLSVESFFHVFLYDYQIYAYNPTIGTTMDEPMLRHTTEAGHKCTIYYFVSPEQNTRDSEPPLFDPLLHVSAISIASEVDIPDDPGRRADLNQIRMPDTIYDTANSNVASEDRLNDEALSFVILFEGEENLILCQHNLDAIVTSAGSVAVNEEDSDGLTDLLDLIKDDAGATISKGCLKTRFQTQYSELTISTTEYHVLETVLSFIDEQELVCLKTFQNIYQAIRSLSKHSSAQSRSVTNMNHVRVNSTCRVHIVITADIRDRTLRIDCSSGSSQFPSFSRLIAESDIFQNASEHEFSSSILFVAEDSITALLSRCRICSCKVSHPSSDSTISLRPSVPSTSNEFAPEPIFLPVETAPACENERAALIRPISGLSDEAKCMLKRMNGAVGAHNTLDIFMENLMVVIKNCNERITLLSCGKDKNSIPEAYRNAAIARCRHCRNQLIQLGKQAKLAAVDAGNHFDEIHKTLCTAIVKILQQSECFDVWETPDERVDKLYLNRRVWASGFPDEEFYREQDARQLANRKKQRQLSQKLRQQQRDKTHTVASR